MPKRSLSDSEEKPGALFGNPPGAMLPLGGIDLGHKGFALGLMVEVLTARSVRHGPRDKPTGGGSPVFLQVIDPEAFAGVDALKRETSWLGNGLPRQQAAPGRRGGAHGWRHGTGKATRATCIRRSNSIRRLCRT